MVFKKIGMVVALGMLAGLVALGPAATSVAAADTTNLVADGQYHALAAGEQTWYTFNYSGDESQIMIEMSAPNGGGFEVWTPEQYAQYQAGQAVEPVGRGSASDYYGGDLIWTGNFNTAGTYYVIVTAEGSQIDYALTISGAGVSLPAAAPAAQAETATAAAPATETATAAAAPVAAPAAKSGANSGDALTIDGQWANIAANQQVWYAVPYWGGNEQLTISMVTDPSNPATFAVYTADEVANGDDPVGRGSGNAAMGDAQVWVGGFADAGTVYVVVSGNGVGNTGYQLTIQ